VVELVDPVVELVDPVVELVETYRSSHQSDRSPTRAARPTQQPFSTADGWVPGSLP
jgi:hypothetical protein